MLSSHKTSHFAWSKDDRASEESFFRAHARHWHPTAHRHEPDAVVAAAPDLAVAPAGPAAETPVETAVQSPVETATPGWTAWQFVE